MCFPSVCFGSCNIDFHHLNKIVPSCVLIYELEAHAVGHSPVNESCLLSEFLDFEDSFPSNQFISMIHANGCRCSVC